MRLKAPVLLFCLAVAGLAAPVLAHADSWSQVVLFDWVYLAGEDAYDLDRGNGGPGWRGWLAEPAL